LDDIVVFHSLGVSEIKQIVSIQLQALTARLAERRIKVSLTDLASLQLATTGFDPVYGARPLKRAIQRDVVNPLAQSLLRGEIKEGDQVSIDYDASHFTFTSEPALV
jgi:ATP-dependent Clp protease ATP-binding subunit ClpB